MKKPAPRRRHKHSRHVLLSDAKATPAAAVAASIIATASHMRGDTAEPFLGAEDYTPKSEAGESCHFIKLTRMPSLPIPPQHLLVAALLPGDRRVAPVFSSPPPIALGVGFATSSPPVTPAVSARARRLRDSGGRDSGGRSGIFVGYMVYRTRDRCPSTRDCLTSRPNRLTADSRTPNSTTTRHPGDDLAVHGRCQTASTSIVVTVRFTHVHARCLT